MVTTSRRGFLGGLLGVLATPAIIKTPGLLMPVKPLVLETAYDPITQHHFLTIDEITRRSIKLWKDTNVFLQPDFHASEFFPPHGWKIGSKLRIRLPDSYFHMDPSHGKQQLLLERIADTADSMGLNLLGGAQDVSQVLPVEHPRRLDGETDKLSPSVWAALPQSSGEIRSLEERREES